MPISYTAKATRQTNDNGTLRNPTPGEPAADFNDLDSAMDQARTSVAALEVAPPAHAHSAADITSGTIAPARLGTGTLDGTTVLHSDGAWKTPAGGTATGSVTQVTGTAPIVVANGTTTPAVSINASSATNRGTMSTAHWTKLEGIAAGATVNSTDAFLLNRANHTGPLIATDVSFTPTGSIAATNVQAALAELAAEGVAQYTGELTSDVILATDGSLTNTSIGFPIGAGETWDVEVVLHWTGTDTASDLRYVIDGPAGATLFGHAFGASHGNTGATFQAATIGGNRNEPLFTIGPPAALAQVFGVLTVRTGGRLVFRVKSPTATGNITLQVGQANTTAAVTTTIHAGGYFAAVRTA